MFFLHSFFFHTYSPTYTQGTQRNYFLCLHQHQLRRPAILTANQKRVWGHVTRERYGIFLLQISIVSNYTLFQSALVKKK